MSDESGYTDAYFYRGNMFLQEKKFHEAVGDYTKTIAFYENTGTDNDMLEQAYYHRGLSYFYKSEYSKAIDDYNRALALNPQLAWAHYAKGFAYYTNNENNQAKKEYQFVISSEDPVVKSYALFGLGLIYVRKKETLYKGMDLLEKSCRSGNCSIACETLDQGISLSQGNVMKFQLP